MAFVERRGREARGDLDLIAVDEHHLVRLVEVPDTRSKPMRARRFLLSSSSPRSTISTMSTSGCTTDPANSA